MLKNLLDKISLEMVIATIGVLGSVVSVLGQNIIITYSFIAILILGIMLIPIKKWAEKRVESCSLKSSWHVGFLSVLELNRDKNKNKGIFINKLVKNIKYTNNNRDSNITYIIEGKIIKNYVRGIYIMIGAGSNIENLSEIGYTVKVNRNDMIKQDDYHFIEDEQKLVSLYYECEIKEIFCTPYSKKLFLPFESALEEKELFQVIFYYTWKNSIVDKTDSTSYLTKELFPNGVKKLVTNLSFSSKPYQIIVYRTDINNKTKTLVENIRDVKQKDDAYIIKWEIDNPDSSYIIEKNFKNIGLGYGIMKQKYFEVLEQFDKYITYVNNVLDYTKYLTPINLLTENEKFIHYYKNGFVYNPIYSYELYDKVNFDELLKELWDFNINDNPFSGILRRYKDYLKNLILFYMNRGNTKEFTQYSINAFGKPNLDIYKKAIEFLKKSSVVTSNPNNSEISGKELANKLQERLEYYGFKWSIAVKDNLSTKVTIDPEAKIIYVNGDVFFSENDVKRLIVHEVDTHVVRAENGFRQPLQIFSSGLAGSLSTEEGLAVYSEEVNNVLDIKTLRLYAGRVIATYLSNTSNFYDIFAELNNYLDITDSMYITQRIKKGLEDTSEHGGFTKDYVYFDGYYRVKKFLELNSEKLSTLFVGSIGLEDIDEVQNLLDMKLIYKPNIIPQNSIVRIFST